MKKKIVIDKDRLTRESRLFPSLYNNVPTVSNSHQQADCERIIEKVDGYWKITFRDKRTK